MHLLEFALGAQGDVRRGLRRGAGVAIFGWRELRETFGDEIDELRVRQVPRRGDHQMVRRVPPMKPCLERVVRQRGNCFGRAEDRPAERVRVPEILCEKLVDQVLGIVLRHADFLEDHALLARDVFGGEFRVEDHVSEDVEGPGEVLVENARVEADHFLRGERVEHAADAVHFARDVFGGAARGALEHHVLDEMRDAVQLGGLAARAGAQPDADGNRADVVHRLGEDHEAVGQSFLVHRVSCVGHVCFHSARRETKSHRVCRRRAAPALASLSWITRRH